MANFSDLLEENDGINEMLDKIDKEAAKARFHELVGVARSIWVEIEDLVEEDKKLEAALRICSKIFYLIE